MPENQFHLTPTEFALYYAAKKRGGFVSDEDLEYGYDVPGGRQFTDEMVDVNLSRIRDKDPDLLEKVKNEGVRIGNTDGLHLDVDTKTFTRSRPESL